MQRILLTIYFGAASALASFNNNHSVIEKIPGCYIVSFKQGNVKSASGFGLSSAQVEIGQASLKSFAKGLGKITAEFKNAGKGFSVCGIQSENQLNSIRANPLVAGISQDQVVKASALQTIPSPLSWGLDRIDQRSNTLDGAFTYNDATAPVNVYVIDTGVNIAHEQFNGRAFAGYNFVDNNADSNDCNGHGTHCAGTIGARDYGVCKHCRIIAVKVMDCAGSGSSTSVISGINWVIEHARTTGIPAVISMSLGSGFFDPVNIAIQDAVNSGIVAVVAAGNDNSDACNYSPASAPSAITVGAISKTGAKSTYSNFGRCVDIFAPGDVITSTWIGSTTAINTISGTSMATPHVAGVAAAYRSYNPLKTPNEVRNYLVDTISTVNSISNLDASSPNKVIFSRLHSAIIGSVDDLLITTDEFVLRGWACDIGLSQPLSIRIFADDQLGNRKLLKEVVANVDSEPGISSACKSSLSTHRYYVPFKYGELSAHMNKPIYVFASYQRENLFSTALPNSGKILVPASAGGPVPMIRGNIDDVIPVVNGFSIRGFSCDRRISNSIDVSLYLGGVPGTGALVLSAVTNLPTEAGVSAVCGTNGVLHRFYLYFTKEQALNFIGKGIFVTGNSNNEQILLTGSGLFRIPVINRYSLRGEITSYTKDATGNHIIQGYACDFQRAVSVKVQLFAGTPLTSFGISLSQGTANLRSTLQISEKCGTNLIAHAFSFRVPAASATLYLGRGIFVRATSSVAGAPKELLVNSGIYRFF
jgi:hypothetical protein